MRGLSRRRNAAFDLGLGQPLWWLCFGMLLANDHLLKGAGVFPAWLTGKLSDFAGLVVLSATLAALFRTPRGKLAAVVSSGFLFAS